MGVNQLTNNQSSGGHAQSIIAIAVLLASVWWVDAAALPPRVELDGRIHVNDGRIVAGAIAPGAVLHTGDEIRLRVTPWIDGHLYVISLGSSGTASLLHPFVDYSATGDQGAAISAPVGAGEKVAVPTDGGFLPLDDNAGREMIVAFVAAQPVESLTRLMFRMEGLSKDPAAARKVLVSAGFELAHISFGHARRSTNVVANTLQRSLTTTPPLASAAGAESTVLSKAQSAREAAVQTGEPGVLGGLGSRIAQFTGKSQAATSPSVEASRPADAKEVTVAASSADESSSSGIGSFFGTLFGSDSDTTPQPAQERPQQTQQQAKTFALPTERREALGLQQRELASLSPSATQAAVPAPRASSELALVEQTSPSVGTGRMVEPSPVEATLSPPGKSSSALPPRLSSPAPDVARQQAALRADGQVQSTLVRLFAGESKAAQKPIPPAAIVKAPEDALNADARAATPAQALTSVAVAAQSPTTSEARAEQPASSPVVRSTQEVAVTERSSVTAASAAQLANRANPTAPIDAAKPAADTGGLFSGLSALFASADSEEEQSSAASQDEPPPATPVGPERPTVTQAPAAQKANTAAVDSTTDSANESSSLFAGLSSLFSAGDLQETQAGTASQNGPSDSQIAASEPLPNAEQASSVQTTPSTPQPQSEQQSSDTSQSGGFLAGLGALFTSPFAAAESSASESDKPPESAQDSGPATQARVNTGAELNIERRTDGSGREVVVLGGPIASRSRAASSQGVLGSSGSRIRALLGEPDPIKDRGVSVAKPSSTAEQPRPVPTAVETAPVVAAAPPDPVQSALSNETRVVAAAEHGRVASTIAQPVQQIALLSAAPATAVARAATQAAVVDLNSASGVASAVVLVVTPQGSTSGVLVDRSGHILTNWNTVHDFDRVVVMFKQSGSSGPARDKLMSARVVAHSKYADLALLKIESVPAGYAPVSLVAKVDAQRGALIHAIGHSGGRASAGQWRHDIANMDRIRRGSSWYSTQRVLHRADVIRAVMDPVRNIAGAPLFNNQLQLIGLGTLVRADKGEVLGVSAATIRAFLTGSG